MEVRCDATRRPSPAFDAVLQLLSLVAQEEERCGKTVCLAHCVLLNREGEEIPLSSTLTDIQGLSVVVREDQRHEKWTSLHQAAWEGQVQDVREALRVWDANLEAYAGVTPVHLAVMRGYVPCLLILLLLGGRLDTVCTESRFTALHLAAREGQDECMKVIVEHKSHNLVTHVDAAGRTPLHLAAIARSEAFVWRLLAARASVDVQDAQQRTAIDYATAARSKAVYRELLNSLAQITKHCSMEVIVDHLMGLCNGRSQQLMIEVVERFVLRHRLSLTTLRCW